MIPDQKPPRYTAEVVLEPHLFQYLFVRQCSSGSGSHSRIHSLNPPDLFYFVQVLAAAS